MYVPYTTTTIQILHKHLTVNDNVLYPHYIMSFTDVMGRYARASAKYTLVRFIFALATYLTCHNLVYFGY